MSKKLILLLVLGMLTLISVGGIGIYAFNDIKQVVTGITEQMIPRIEAAHRLGTNYRDLRLLLLSHINEDDDFLKKAFSEKISVVEQDGQKALEKYEQFTKNRVQEKVLINAYKEYIKVHHEALAYSANQQKDLAQVALYGKALPITQKMEVLLRASAEQDTRDEKEAALRVEQVYRQAIMFFLLGTSGACALFGLLAWWLLREQSTSAHLAIKAQTDALTGIGNRAYFNEKTKKALEDAQKNKTTLGIFYMDLNGFKPINDTYGHDIGDEVLKEVALRLQKTLRSNDIIARLGGDEFAFAIIPGVDDNFNLVAERIVSAFDLPMLIKEHHLNVYGSVGICIYPQGGNSIDSLIKNADAAMYKAKALAKQKKKGAFVFANAVKA